MDVEVVARLLALLVVQGPVLAQVLGPERVLWTPREEAPDLGLVIPQLLRVVDKPPAALRVVVRQLVAGAQAPPRGALLKVLPKLIAARWAGRRLRS